MDQGTGAEVSVIGYEQKVRDTVACPACQAKAGARCTRPTETGRSEVVWLHIARLDAYNEFRPTLGQTDRGVDVADWQYLVANGDTLLGYKEWVEHEQEASRVGG